MLVLQRAISEEQNRTKRENRHYEQQKNIISYLAKSSRGLSILEIAESVGTSIPTCTKLVKDLVEQSLVIKKGKKSTDNGRKPTIYGLNKDNFYVVGVEILSKWIHVSVLRIDLETVYENFSRAFVLEDTAECLSFIIDFIETSISVSIASISQIIGVGIGITGNVNRHTGQSANYFKGGEAAFKEQLENQLNLPVIIDNDTRAIGVAEQVMGIAKGVENALIVKVSRDLGLSIIVNREIIFGGIGFAGNFGNTQYIGTERLCECGKKGCLKTLVSGAALKKDLMEALEAGESSPFFEQHSEFSYHNILDAALKGDRLSTQLLQSQGDKLGQALGNVVNLLNPSLIVIGGEFVMVERIFIDAVKSGIQKTAMVDALQSCEIQSSSLGRYLSSKAGACMLLKNYEMIEY